MSADYMSYGDVARALNTTLARARGLRKGLEPSLTVGTGRVVLFDRQAVREALYASHKDVIQFIGYLSPGESYDVAVSIDTVPAGE